MHRVTPQGAMWRVTNPDNRVVGFRIHHSEAVALAARLDADAERYYVCYELADDPRTEHEHFFRTKEEAFKHLHDRSDYLMWWTVYDTLTGQELVQ